MHKYFTFFFLLFLPFQLSGQENIAVLRGEIIDSNSKDPIPFVNIRLNDYYYGTSTNLDGQFELKLKTDRFDDKNELRISCIGYKSKVIKLSDINPKQYQKIELTPQLNNLDDVIVRSARAKRKENNQAKTIVMDAIGSIPSNRAKSNFLAKSFYRHYCKEDTSYVRLTEAAIDLFQYKRGGKFVQIPEERLQFGLSQMRRSFDYTSFAKLSHPPISLNFLLSNDLTNYEFHNPIRRNLDSYEFVISDTTSIDNDPVIVIEFEPKEPKKLNLNYSGKLYINLQDKGFIRTDIKETQVYSNSIDSISSSISKQAFFQKIGKRYYPQRLISNVTAVHFFVSNDKRNSAPVKHESHVELMVNELIPKSKIKLSMGEPTEEELRNIQYDSTFWKGYTVLQATPLEDKIIQDLSKKVDLNKQFEAINRLKEGIQSVVDDRDFQELLAPLDDKPIYTILWAKWSVPNFYELIPSPYLRKMIKKGRVKLLMVSLDDEEEDWIVNRELYGLDKPYIIHKKLKLGFGNDITQKFFKELMPDFFLLKDGKIIDHSPPLPNEVEVKAYYQYLVKNGLVKPFSR